MLSPKDQVLLDAIDNDLTQIMVCTDKKCQKHNDSPWSPALKTAYYEHQYWTLKLSALSTKHSYQQAYEAICHHLDPTILHLKPNKTISSQQHQAGRTLRKVCINAQNKGKQFLDNLLQVAAATKDKQWHHLIIGLKHAKDNW